MKRRPKIGMQPRKVDVEGWIAKSNMILKFLGTVFTLGVPVSLVIGSFFLLAYLHSNGAPFPVFSGSVTSLLVLIPLVFMVIFVPFCFIFGSPDLSRIFLVEELEAAAPELNTAPWHRRYFNYYVGFLIYSATYAVIPFVNLDSGRREWVWIAAFFFIPFLCSWVLRPRPRSKLSPILLSVPALMSNLWFVLSMGFTLTVLAHCFPRPWRIPDWLVVIAVSIALIGIHYYFVKPRRITGHFLLPAVILAFILFYYPGPAYTCGFILQYLGVGGDIPVTLVLKEESSAKEAFASADSTVDSEGISRLSGCLILQFGEVIILRPSVNNCRLRVRTSSELPPKPLSQVVRISSADVLEVRPYEGSPAQSK